MLTAVYLSSPGKGSVCLARRHSDSAQLLPFVKGIRAEKVGSVAVPRECRHQSLLRENEATRVQRPLAIAVPDPERDGGGQEEER